MPELETYPIYQGLGSLEFKDRLTEEEIRERLPSNQVREFDSRRGMNLPFHFFYHRNGQLMINHRPDPLGGLG